MMSKTIRRFLSLALLLCPFFAFSQYNYYKGYVVTNAGDTLKGYVQGKEMQINPKSVRFKLKMDSEIQNFSVLECAGFGIYDKESYERYGVKISLGATKLRNLSVGIDTSFKEESVFLKVLQKGKNINLYAYEDNIKVRFYVKEKLDLLPYELIYYSYLKPEEGVSAVVSSRRYQGQLALLFDRFGVSVAENRKLQSNTYNVKDMVRVAAVINDQKITKSKSLSSSFFAGLGINKYMLSYYDDAAEGSSQKSSITPFVNGGVDVYMNPEFRKIIFRFEGSLSMLESELSKKNLSSALLEMNYRLKQYNAALAAHVFYNFYNKENIKFYAGVGVAIAYLKTERNDLVYRYLYSTHTLQGPVLEKVNLAIPFSLGSFFGKRFEVSLSYTMSGAISDDWASHTNYVGYGIKMQRIRAGVNYHFK